MSPFIVASGLSTVSVKEYLIAGGNSAGGRVVCRFRICGCSLPLEAGYCEVGDQS